MFDAFVSATYRGVGSRYLSVYGTCVYGTLGDVNANTGSSLVTGGTRPDYRFYACSLCEAGKMIAITYSPTTAQVKSSDPADAAWDACVPCADGYYCTEGKAVACPASTTYNAGAAFLRECYPRFLDGYEWVVGVGELLVGD